MGIEIKLFATLCEFLPKDHKDYPIDDGETVKSLMDKLGIPEEEVTLVFINNTKAEQTSVLNDKDRVGLFPPVGGG